MQRPCTNAEIKTFCSLKYGVTFTMTAKILVKGNNSHPIYKWLTAKEANKKMGAEVAWNFNNYLLDENGQLVDFYPSSVDPFEIIIFKSVIS